MNGARVPQKFRSGLDIAGLAVEIGWIGEFFRVPAL